MTRQDHMESKLAHHGNTHVNEAMGGLFQEQSAAQVGVLCRKKNGSLFVSADAAKRDVVSLTSLVILMRRVAASENLP